MKNILIENNVKLEKIVGGGQAMGALASGKKIFVWGGLPGELVDVIVTKKKSKMVEGFVGRIIKPSDERIEPKDPDSYLSTSPWQIMSFEAEQSYKSALIKEAFSLHNIDLIESEPIFSDDNQYNYRNKVEYSWWWDKKSEKIDLAFFKRGSHGKIAVEKTSLAKDAITQASIAVRDLLRSTDGLMALDLKTLLIRCNRAGETIAQLYIKNKNVKIDNQAIEKLIDNKTLSGFEVIYSDPKSPASRISERLQSFGNKKLFDTVLSVPFSYAPESFFQVNLPVYEAALTDIKRWIMPDKPVTDLYSGVGTIGLTTAKNVTMVEENEQAVTEMQNNILSLGLESSAIAVLAKSEDAIEYIYKDATIIVDPPRAGLHQKVIDKLLEEKPLRIIYLSCNPVTQARDASLLKKIYNISYSRGYNFFPRTPHIENLVILDLK